MYERQLVVSGKQSWLTSTAGVRGPSAARIALLNRQGETKCCHVDLSLRVLPQASQRARFSFTQSGGGRRNQGRDDLRSVRWARSLRQADADERRDGVRRDQRRRWIARQTDPHLQLRHPVEHATLCPVRAAGLSQRRGLDGFFSTITSASREVIRPILDKNETLLICPQQYEGGVCDKNVFLLGCTPTMQVKEPLKWAIEAHGKRIYYIGADYNAPRIQGDWTKKFAKRTTVPR